MHFVSATADRKSKEVMNGDEESDSDDKLAFVNVNDNNLV